MANNFDVDKFEHRLELTRLRVSVIHHTLTLALATSAIPIVLAGLFNLQGLKGHFWTLTVSGWLALGLSMLGGILFLSQVPRWARDKARAQRSEWGYVICIGAFLLGVILLGCAGYIAVTCAALRP